MSGRNQVQIINLALSHLKQKPIQSTSESTVNAQAAMREWDAALDECLGCRNWGFASVIDTLVLVSEDDYTVPPQWLYAYAYPTKALAVWRLYNEGTADMKKGEPFRRLFDPDRNVSVIVTNVEDAYAEYSYSVSDTTKYSPFFVNMLSHRLAVPLALSINGDEKLSEGQLKIYFSMKSEAERQDSYENQEAPPERTSGYQDARG